MSMAYIRQTYKVPAKRGARIEFDDQMYHFIYGFMAHQRSKCGTITGSRSGYIKVRFDGTDYSVILHPTYNVRYL